MQLLAPRRWLFSYETYPWIYFMYRKMCDTVSEQTVRTNEEHTITKTHDISWTIFFTRVPWRKKLIKQLQYLLWFTVPTVCSIAYCLWVCLTCTFEAITTDNCRYHWCTILHSYRIFIYPPHNNINVYVLFFYVNILNAI